LNLEERCAIYKRLSIRPQKGFTRHLVITQHLPNKTTNCPYTLCVCVCVCVAKINLGDVPIYLITTFTFDIECINAIYDRSGYFFYFHKFLGLYSITSPVFRPAFYGFKPT